MQIDVAKCDRIVRWVACKLGATFPVADSDEYADGWIGMVKAMKKYDPDKINPESGKSYMLSTYAVRWIKAYIPCPPQETACVGAWRDRHRFREVALDSHVQFARHGRFQL